MQFWLAISCSDLAYRQLLRSSVTNARHVTQLLTDAFVAVCEGQALDVEFGRRSTITLREYFRMIDRKTGKIIATAAEIGGVIGNGSDEEVRALRMFGMHIGRAFQIQDDLLDVMANEKDLGKRIGGDIVEGKKTFLLIAAAGRARGTDNIVLRSLTPGSTRTRDAKQKRAIIRQATAIYHRYGVIDEAHRRIQRETTAGLSALRRLPNTADRSMLQWFAQTLVQRTF